jgi:hypothetical protein
MVSWGWGVIQDWMIECVSEEKLEKTLTSIGITPQF